MRVVAYQMKAFERFGEALEQLHWVLAAMIHCDNEIDDLLRTYRKRKIKMMKLLNLRTGSLFVHVCFAFLF